MKQIQKFNYLFYSNQPSEKIKSGDILETPKGKRAKVVSCYKYGNRLVFVTDKFGLVFENEIEAGRA
jgi:hypothetical protein